MKSFITLKVGYTAGVYGCSNEYFNTIIIDGDNILHVAHCGLYGSEERINAALKAKGYNEVYIPSDYGQMKKKEIWRGFVSEQEALDYIDIHIK